MEIDDSQLFRTETYSRAQEVCDAVLAAEVLNLGIAITNQWREDGEDPEHQSAQLEWTVQLFTLPPTVTLDDEDE